MCSIKISCQTIGNKLLVLDEFHKLENKNKSLTELALVAAKKLNLRCIPHKSTIKKWIDNEPRMRRTTNKLSRKVQKRLSLSTELNKWAEDTKKHRQKTYKYFQNIKTLINEDPTTMNSHLIQLTVFLQHYKNECYFII